MKALRSVPMPKPRRKPSEREICQAKVEIQLKRAVVAEARARGLCFQDVMEWGLRQWLLYNNPKAAAELGISIED